MEINDKIEARRKELDLTEMDVIKKAGITSAVYQDIELHADEIYDVTSIGDIKKILKVLGLNFFDLFNLKCSFCENEVSPELYKLQRNDVIHNRRIELGMSISDLGDRIGMYDYAVLDIEKDQNMLDEEPFIVITDLAGILDIPVQILFGVKCTKCNR